MLEIPLKIEVVLLGAVIAQGIFASLALLFQQHNRRANRLLSLLVLGFSLWLCDLFFRTAQVYQQDPNYYFLPIYFSLAFGPLVYFYTRALTENAFVFKRQHLLHFIPVFIQVSLYVFLQVKNYSFRRWFWLEVHKPYTYDLEFYLSLLSLLVYLFIAIRRVFEYQQWINNQYSEISKIRLNWLKLVLGLLLSITILWLIDAFLRAQQFYPEQPLSAIAMGVSVLLLAGGGLLQIDLKGKGMSAPEPIAHPDPETIDPMLLDRIVTEMENQKYYLNQELSLDAFSRALGIPARQVSLHINQGLGLPFIDFVNTYRVEAVKRHIQSNDLPHLSLLGIAFEAGFNSKSTFNRVFKNAAGISPSEYQKRHMK
ncbi:MAG: helix-turn-helix domain-containing protein [Saprospiraceae bacterium]